ncbi:MAG: 16S rRNA (guanine(527)-N(7))-methyltransferase RsmG [Nitrospiraceae bacterium]
MEHNRDFSEYVTEAAKVVSVSLSKEQVDKFSTYLTELKRWNATTNLTSLAEDQEIIVKHFIDSIAILRFIDIEPHSSVLDIGAGAGFPSIPLKIVRSDLRPSLLESNAKKVSFIRYITGILALHNVAAVSTTLARFATTCTQRFDCVVVRAFRIGHWNRQVSTLLKDGGIGIVYRATPMPDGEVPEGAQIRDEFRYQLPFGYGSRVFTLISWSR